MWSIAGLPVHPLVVHAAVVLVPLCAVAITSVALSPNLRRRFGVLLFVTTTVAVVSTVGAVRSGRDLEDQLYPRDVPVSVVNHEDIGGGTVWFVVAMWASLGCLLLLDIDARRRAKVSSPLLPTVIAVLAVIVSLLAAGQTLRAGWSGARAHWVGAPVVRTAPNFGSQIGSTHA